ncbi:MAG: hypothetical protein WC343_14700, partial [Bacilli bacterium]
MKRLLLILALLVVLVAPAAAQITAEVGETWIRWDYPAIPGNDTLIIIDGVERGAADRGMYYLTDLNPNEEHQIDLINASTGAATDVARVRTLSPI